METTNTENKKVNELLTDAAILIHCVERLSADRLKISFDLAEGIGIVDTELGKFKTGQATNGFKIIIENTVFSSNYHIVDENGECLCGKNIPKNKKSPGFVLIENIDIICNKCQDILVHKHA